MLEVLLTADLARGVSSHSRAYQAGIVLGMMGNRRGWWSSNKNQTGARTWRMTSCDLIRTSTTCVSSYRKQLRPSGRSFRPLVMRSSGSTKRRCKTCETLPPSTKHDEKGSSTNSRRWRQASERFNPRTKQLARRHIAGKRASARRWRLAPSDKELELPRRVRAPPAKWPPKRQQLATVEPAAA